jgi:hypothetical protein
MMVLADKQLLEKVFPFSNNQRHNNNRHDDLNPIGSEGGSKSEVDGAGCGGYGDERPIKRVMGVVCHVQQNMGDVADKN